MKSKFLAVRDEKQIPSSNGNLVWFKDARGFITHWQYKETTLVRRVNDVDTSLYPTAPDGWTTPVGGGGI